MGSLRTRKHHKTALCFILMMPLSSTAQQAPANSESRDAVCILNSGKQMSAHYVPTEAGGGPNASPGKVWTPGGSAMTLFTETELKIGDTVLPIGAYTMYLIPGRKSWTLLVCRNQKIDAVYDEHQDLVRQPMQTAALDKPEERLSLFFGHVGPARCELNVSYDATRAWVDFAQN